MESSPLVSLRVGDGGVGHRHNHDGVTNLLGLLMISKKGPGVVRTTDRQRQALDLRVRGLTFERIGEELDISHQAAQVLVSNGLRSLREESAELAAELRQIELMRLDAIQDELMQLVEKAHARMEAADEWNKDPDHADEPHVSFGGEQLLLQTIDRLLKVIERRARIAGLEHISDSSEDDPWVAVLVNIQRRVHETNPGHDRTVTKEIPATATVSEVGDAEDSGPIDAPDRRTDKRKDKGARRGRSNRNGRANGQKKAPDS